ncbi:hypothetical protein Droror1_Dr00007828 [Drosera rotundifolia]
MILPFSLSPLLLSSFSTPEFPNSLLRFRLRRQRRQREVGDSEERPRGFGVVVPEEDCARRSDSDFGVNGDGEKSAMARRDHVDLGSSSPKRIDSDAL